MENTALFVVVICLAVGTAVLLAVLFAQKKKPEYLPDDEYSWRHKPLSGRPRKKLY